MTIKWWHWVLGVPIVGALVTYATQTRASTATTFLDVGSPPPPPPPKWTVEDMRTLAAIATRLKMNPADLLLVMWSESGGDPHAAYIDEKGVQVTAGLNQILRAYAINAGLTDSQWVDLRNWSVGKQLPHVETFFRSIRWTQDGKVYPNAGGLYAINFAPSRVQARGMQPDVVLYDRADGQAYERNKGFDVTGDGRITIRDLIERLRTVSKRASYKGALAMLRSATGAARLSPGLPE